MSNTSTPASRRRHWTNTLVVLGAAAAVAACDDGSSTALETADGLQASVEIGRITVSPENPSVSVGDSVQLTATVTNRNGTVLKVPVTWSSSKTTTAAVEAGTGMVRGVAAGDALIVASAGGRTGTAFVTVTPGAPPGEPERPSVASVTVLPSPASLEVGASLQLSAVARDAGGNMIPAEFTWSSSNGAVARVSASGLVTGAAAGSATVTATTAGVSGSTAVTVTAVPPPVTTVVVTPASASVDVGSTVQLAATARDRDGNPVSSTFTWVSSNPAIASVNTNGRVTGVAAGSVVITATTAGVSGTSNITVTSPAAPPPPPPPPPPSGNTVLFSSDWRTALGNSLHAVTDGGRWDIASRSFDRTMNIIPSTGLDFPTSNVYQVIGVADMEGWSMLRKTGMPIPAVGESRYYRWYIRITMPDGLSDYNTHPIQDGVAGSQTNWMFIVINAGGGGVPAGQWQPQFWATSAPYPYQRWYGPTLNKNQTYRFELHVHRVTTSEFRMSVRVYNSANTLIASNAEFRNYGTATLASNMSFPLTNPNTMDGLNAGNNGIAGSAPWPFTISYQGAFAVCATTWCGPYNGNY